MQQVLHRQVYLYDISDRLAIFTPKSKPNAANNGTMLSDGQDAISDSQIDSSQGNQTVRIDQSALKGSFLDNEEDGKRTSGDQGHDQPRQEYLTQSMPMFIDDPIIANLP